MKRKYPRDGSMHSPLHFRSLRLTFLQLFRYIKIMLHIHRTIARHLKHAGKTVSALYHTDDMAAIGSHVDIHSSDYKVPKLAPV